jgi:CDP-glucose 4,6-dehydratase
MGGHDPYSSSKGCSELVVSAYRRSFFPPDAIARHGLALGSARAGNVIGGGDWAEDRLVPDLMRGFSSGMRPRIRFPGAVRPWQHVLEPLSGYILLAQRLWEGDAMAADGWNFGPDEADARPVAWVADRAASLWGAGAGWAATGEARLHEARLLRLDCSKARERLSWRPAWGLDEALARTVEWYRALREGARMDDFTRGQIRAHPAYGAVPAAG